MFRIKKWKRLNWTFKYLFFAPLTFTRMVLIPYKTYSRINPFVVWFSFWIVTANSTNAKTKQFMRIIMFVPVLFNFIIIKCTCRISFLFSRCRFHLFVVCPLECVYFRYSRLFWSVTLTESSGRQTQKTSAQYLMVDDSKVGFSICNNFEWRKAISVRKRVMASMKSV